MSFNNHKKNTRPRNVTMKIELIGRGTDKSGREFDRSSLLTILSDFDFSKISIPAYTYRNLIYGEDKKGTIAIGYIRQFNPEDETFSVLVYNASVEAVKSFEDVVVYPRMIIDEETGEVKTILSLDIGPCKFFE